MPLLHVYDPSMPAHTRETMARPTAPIETSGEQSLSLPLPPLRSPREKNGSFTIAMQVDDACFAATTVFRGLCQRSAGLLTPALCECLAFMLRDRRSVVPARSLSPVEGAPVLLPRHEAEDVSGTREIRDF